MAVKFSCKKGSQCPLSSLCLVGGLIDDLSTASTHSLYSTFEAVMRPIDTKHQKAACKDNEN